MNIYEILNQIQETRKNMTLAVINVKFPNDQDPNKAFNIYQILENKLFQLITLLENSLKVLKVGDSNA